MKTPDKTMSPQIKSLAEHSPVSLLKSIQAVFICFFVLVGMAAQAATDTWTNDASGVWSNGANWLGGSAPGGVDAIADFGAIDITGDRTVTLDVPRTYGAFNFGDASGAQNWLLNNSGGSLMTLGVSSGSPTFNVTNTATVTAPLAGTSGLTKAGPGTLVLGGTNSYAGDTIVTNGTLKLTNSSTGPLLYMSFDNVSGSTVVNGGSLGAVADGLIVGTNVSVVAGGRYGNGLQVGAGPVTSGGVFVNNAVTLLNNTNNTAVNAWTVAMWVKTTTTTNGGLLYQGGNTWASGNTRFYTAGNANDTGGPFFGGVRNSQGWQVGQIPINDGNWHFVAMTTASPGNVKKIYVDGNLDTFSATAGNNAWTNNASGNQVWIGGAPNISDNNQGLNGLIDEVYIYNRALSQLEITNLLNTSSTPAPLVILPPSTAVSVAAATKLDVNGVNATVTGLSGVGTVDNTLTNAGAPATTPTFTINNSSAATFTGFISNTAGILSVVKNGAGALTLSNLNGYTGNTILNAGTLNINHASAIGTAGTLIINGGTIDNTSGTAVTVVNNKSATWSGDFTFTGTSNLSFGTGGVTLGGPGAGRTVTVNGSNILTVGALNGTFGPGYDLIKNGTGTLLLNANSTLAGRTLAVNAGTLSLGGDLNICANLTGTGTIQTSGTGVNKWFFINTPAGSNEVFSGTLQNFPGQVTRGLGFNKTGLGSITLNGNCTFNDTITLQQGRVNLSGSGVNISHTNINEAASAVGTIAGTPGILTVSNGALVTFASSSAANPFTGCLNIGSTALAFGDVRVDNSTVIVSNQLAVGGGGYGAYSQSSGLTTVGGFIACGNNTNGGVINLSGGTLLHGLGIWSGYGVTLGYGGVNAGTHGVMNVYNNASYLLGGNAVGIWPGEVNNGTFNMWGSPTVTVTNDGVQLGRGNAAGNGVLNLNGGTLSVNFIRTGPGVGTFNFNGGMLKANAQATAGFMQGTVAPTLLNYSGGATIDDGGFAISITAPIQAPGGYGVASIPITFGGSNYIDTPLILISGGSGTGAKAASQIDYVSGSVTNIVITCPGNNYNNADTLTFTIAGGGGTNLTLGAPTFAVNASGGLTKLGSGTLALNGGYSFTNAIRVSGGTLAVSTVSVPSPAGDVIVSNNAALLADVSSGTAMPANSLKLGTNTALTIDYGTLTGGNPTFAAINVAGGLSAPGTNIVINIAGFGLKTNTSIVLIDYTGAPLGSIANFSLGSLPPGVAGYLVNNTANASLDFAITNAGQNLYWRGVDDFTSLDNNNWNINTTTNWYSVGDNLPAVYLQYTNGANIVGDPVLFNDTPPTGVTNINLAATVRPFIVRVDSSLPYSITGAGSIAGVASVVKTNSGSILLGTSNNYTGGTFIYQGSVIITNNSGLGTNTGSVTLAGGSLQVNSSLTGTHPVTLTANSSIGVAAGATATWSARISGANAFTKTDTGTLTTTVTNGLSGNVFVKQGTLTVDSGGVITNNTWVSIGQALGDNATNTLKGTGLFASSFDFNVGDIDDAIGTLNIQDSANLSVANLFVSSANNAGSTANGTVNQTGGTVTQTNTAAGFFTIGGRNAATTGGVGVYNLSGGTVTANGAVRLGGNGTGTVNQTNGTFNARQGINIARFAGSTGTYNLVGGTLAAFNIASSTAVNATFNFNGGVLLAAFSPGNPFMSGLSQANVLAGGAIIDASSNNITISQALLDGGGGGGLTKRGIAALTLTGSNTYAGTTLVSTGALFVTTAHQVTGPTTIADNATFGVNADTAGTATIGNLTLGSVSNSTLQFTLLSGTNPIAPILQCGTLTKNGTNTIRLSGLLTPGTFPLVQYTSQAGVGIIKGTAITPHGIVGTISNDNVSKIWVIVTGTPGVVWQGYSTIAGRTNLWDLNATTNWLAAGSPSDYTETTPPGDSVTFNDTGSSTVLLSNTVSPASVLITNNSVAYTFTGSGRIAGTTGLTKMGTGTATLAFTNANTYTGNTVISNGVLQLGAAANIPDATGSLIVGSAGTLQLNGFGETINGLAGSGLVDNSAAGAVTLTVGSGGASSTWSGTITNTGAGAVNILKAGAGSLTISGTNYLGGGNSQMNGGTNFLTATGRIEPVGTGEFWVMQNAGTARMEINGGSLTVNSWLVVARNASNANGTLVVNSGTVQKGGANNIVVGSLNGFGLLEINGGQVLNNGNLWVGENNQARATVRLNGGLLQATQVRPQGTTPLVSEVYFNGGIMQAYTNSDDFFGTNAANARSVFTIEAGGLFFDTQGFSVTNQADLQNDGSSLGGLVKLGSGLLAINSTGNSYAAMTTVSNGTLNVNGSIPGDVTVKSGATLGGNGTIAGVVTVQAGGKLGAGGSIGALTLNSTPVLGGAVVAELDPNGGSPISDIINVSGNPITYGGALVLTNVGAPLTAGQTFTLFSASGYGGVFSSVVSQTPGQAVTWNTNNLTLNGQISVATVGAGVASNPTNITYTAGGGSITLSWPVDHLGWFLQSQTNSRSIGLSNNWTDIPGSELMTSTNFPVSPTSPTVFYRLRIP